MKFNEHYLCHLDEKTLKDKRLDAYIEYDKHQKVATLSFVMAIMLGFVTCILFVAHALLLAIDGAIPSVVVFVTLGILSFASVVVTPALKQRQLENHIERINCALASKKGRADAREDETRP